jgi:hypothetical protein
MTSHLPSNEVELFRSLKKTAIVLMLLFRLDKPLGESQIACILDIHPETTRIYLRSLARLGLVTRTHRFNGWTLTAGGRQMILGESQDRWPVLGPGKIKTSAENPRSIPESPAPSAENPRSISETPTSSAENPRSISRGPAASAENPRSISRGPAASAENPRSTAEIPRSRPVAAASLSLSFKQKRNTAAAAIATASVKLSRSSVKPSRSRVGPSRSPHSHRPPNGKKKDRSARGRPRSDPMVRANLEAFASIGLACNDFVLEICKMDHVTPDYILGQKKRLKAERRYSNGLLLTVIRSNDYLPAKYITRDKPESQPRPTEDEQGIEEEPDDIQKIEPDPSIYEPISASGLTAAKAWSTALEQLRVNMPKAAYDKWVRDAVLLSSEGGVLMIGPKDDFARD